MTLEDKLQTIAENVPKVYNKGYYEGDKIGYENGHSEGYNLGKEEGYHEGQQAEYDAFWDAYQDNGERTDYSNGFTAWSTRCFYPKYDLNVVGSGNYGFNQWRGGKIDLAERLEECGVKLDTSGATSFQYTFYSQWVDSITRIPKIDTTGADRIEYTFCSSPALITIDELVLREDGSQTFVDVFSWSQNLTNLKVSGTIGTSGFKLNTNSKLSKESIISVVNALSSTVAGQTQTFSATAVNNAFEGGSAGSEWLDLIEPKRAAGWSFALV